MKWISYNITDTSTSCQFKRFNILFVITAFNYFPLCKSSMTFYHNFEPLLFIVKNKINRTIAKFIKIKQKFDEKIRKLQRITKLWDFQVELCIKTIISSVGGACRQFSYTVCQRGCLNGAICALTHVILWQSNNDITFN